MYIYILFVLFSLHFINRESILSNDYVKRQNFRYSLVPLFIILALKGVTVGADTPGYLRNYIQVNDVVLYSFRYDRIEPGYTLFVKILNLITHNPQFLLIVVALIVCVCLYYFIIRNTERYCLSCFLFLSLGFMQFALTGIRQTLAISILLIVYEFVKKRKLIYFILGLLVAASFHKSATFFAPAYFIPLIKLSRKNIFLILVAIIVSYNFADAIFLYAADSMEYNYGIEETSNGYMFLSLVILITIYGIRNMKSLTEQSADNYFLISLNFMSLFLWVLRLVSFTAERVSLYYLPFTVLLLSSTLTIPRKYRRDIVMVITLVAAFLLIYRINQHGDLSNYQFFFQVDDKIQFDRIFNY